MRKTQKIFTLVIAILMTLTSLATAFATINFTDVAHDYWGRGHIIKMAQANIVSGMVEGGKQVFKPENPVTKVQALHMIFRTLRATNRLQSTENYTDKYKDVLSSYGIPAWSYEALAYALEYNILEGGEVPNLMRGLQEVNATRQEVAVYLGKAMNPSRQFNTIYPLSFIDREMIDSTALPYVQFLVGKNIISGDNTNRFHPKSTITRAQMAAITSKAYDYLKTADVIVEVPVPQEPKTTTKFRTIEYIVSETRSLVVRDNDNNPEIYQIQNSTEIIINGVKRSFNNLAKGQKANFVFDQDNKLIKIEVNPSENKYEGFIEKITLGSTYDSIMVYDEYRPLNDRRRSFRVYKDDNVEILLDGKKAEIKDLKEEDQIAVIYDGERAIKITSYSRIQDITGLLAAPVNFTRYPFTITIEGVNNQVTEYQIDEAVVVRRDNRRSTLQDLIRGDIITLTLNSGKVSRIEATSFNAKKKDEGTIKSITFGNPNKLTIIDKDNKEVSYDIAQNVSLYIDDERSTLYDLRVGYSVELELQGNTITAIEAKKISQRNSIEGEIVRFHDSINCIIVRAYNPQERNYEEIPIFVNKDTRIIDKDGKIIDMRYLNRRDIVFVTGKYEEDIFIATRIIVLKD